MTDAVEDIALLRVLLGPGADVLDDILKNTHFYQLKRNLLLLATFAFNHLMP